ncbi:MAG: hypothetical protein Q8P54_02065 [bacterium]|nr:hypothetical protein [bacterium]
MAKKYSYEIKQDIYRDAWNWWNGCNRISHGINWKERVSSKIVEKISGKDEKEAFKFLIPYLRKKYIDEKDIIKDYKSYIESEFKQKFERSCEKLVRVMSKPLYRNDFTIYLTTFPRGPYNKNDGSMWFYINWHEAIRGFLHELCHFQFIHYWRENSSSPVSKLTDKEFEYLKESLTIILDEDFMPLIKAPDKGYPIYQEFRKKLRACWKEKKDFEELVKFGVESVPKYL